ncbi:MAG: threonine ammonia-lyase [Thermodesulfovibrionales bacterium]
MINLKDIRDACERISPYIHRTPLIRSDSISKLAGAEVYLKAENLQKTGSFKVRGAINKMVRLKKDRVIAASMGNHAQGVAYAAKVLGKKVRIIMPVTSPIIKQEATKGYGAEVVLYGNSFGEALDYALSDKGYEFIHAFDDEDVIAGQGSIGLEIMDELKDIDTILVPVGGGGLISGIAVAVKCVSPQTEVIGLQTEAASSGYRSFKKGVIEEASPGPTIADGIAVGRIGNKTFEVIRRYVDDIFLVKEDSIAMAILLFMERKKLVVEGAGAVGLALLLENKDRFRGKKVIIVVSGGNIDFTLIDRIIHRGLVKNGRISVFEVMIDDVPGSLNGLTGIIAFHGGNILHVFHDRLGTDIPIGKTRVIFTIETRGREHLKEILSDIESRGLEYKVQECK